MKFNALFLLMHLLSFFSPLCGALELLINQNNVSYELSKFMALPTPTLYLGISHPDGGNFSLVRTMVENAEEELPKLVFTTLAEKEVYINPIPEDEKNNIPAPKKQANPLSNNYFSDLTTMGSLPTVVLMQDPLLGSKKKIAIAQSKDTVITTTEVLNDAGGDKTSGIARIVGSPAFIFAAVGPQNGFFGTGNSGLSMVTSGSHQLVTVDAVSGQLPGNRAVLFDRAAAGGLMAITSDCLMNSIIDMYWDDTLKRLFIALSLTRADQAVAGGCVALLVARIEPSDVNNPYKIALQATVPPKTTNFIADDTTFIVGFFNNAGGAANAANIYKVRTLHTSTARSYLIVNGGVGVGSFKNMVYAIPVVPPVRDGNGILINGDNQIGLLAKKTDPFSPVESVTDMTRSTDAAALVGAGPLPTNSTTDVQEIFTSGDAVFVALASSTATTAGIFKSSALFSFDGNLSGWTPWQRVMGSTDPVFGGGFDKSSGEFLYLTADSSGKRNTVKSTLWGQGLNDGLLGGPNGIPSVGLVSLLSLQLPRSAGGVLSLFDFDEATPSFKQIGTSNNLGVIVATGVGKVVLIESGSQAPGGVYTPTTGDFMANALSSDTGFAPAGSANARVMEISGGVLSAIGSLTSADVSRVDAAEGDGNKGYLFVAGRHGVAVLSEDNGDGWNTQAGVGLERGFVGITSTMSFKQVGTFSDVRKVAADNQFLYVLTSSAFYKIALLSSNFSTTGAPNPTIITLGTASDITAVTNATLYDVLVSSKIAVVGSSAGLFRSGDQKNIMSATNASEAGWRNVLLSLPNGTSTLFEPYPSVIEIDLLSAQKGNLAHGGMLYILAVDPMFNLGYVYRFSLADTASTSVGPMTLAAVQEPDSITYFMALGRMQSYVRTDGSLVFIQSSKRFGVVDFLEFVSVMKNITITSLRGFPIELDIDKARDRTTSLLIRNSASGAWMVPGDFGIRVNE